jgi:hypothetical protein
MSQRFRRRRRERKASLLGAITLAIWATVGVAAASQLGVNSTDISEFFYSACSTDTVSVRVSPAGFGASRSAVSISGFPAACYGSTVQVGVSNSAGTLLASGSATCSAATCTVSTGTYNAPSVTDSHILVDTWGIPSSWDTTCRYIIFFWYCN